MQPNGRVAEMWTASAAAIQGATMEATGPTWRPSVEDRVMREDWRNEDTIGALIARLRAEQGISQYVLTEELAAVSGNPCVTREYVTRWENGRRIPTPYWRRHLAGALDVPVSMLHRGAAVARKPGRRAWRDGEDHGRDGTPEASDGDPVSAEELRRRLQMSGAADTGLVEVYRAETHNIRVMDRYRGAPAVRERLALHIAELEMTLRHTLRLRPREALAGVLADALTLAGWHAVDMCQLPAAWELFERAKPAAREAGDASLFAFAAAEQAYVLVDLGEPDQAWSLIREVSSGHARRVPARLRSWLKAAEAEIAAECGREAACHRALADAERLLPDGDVDTELPFLALNRAHLMRWRGNCLVRFGDADTIEDLTQAVGAMDGSFRRAEASLRCDLAHALAVSGDRAEARVHLGRADDLAMMVGSRRQQQRIGRLAATLR